MVVPLSKRAAEALVLDDVNEATQVVVVPIETQEEFEDIWRLGLFETINVRMDICLDDYETEVVTPSDVKRLKDVISSVKYRVNKCDAQANFLRKLLGLCDIALENEMPVYFIL